MTAGLEIRASALAVTGLRSELDELVAYYDGVITENEWLSLQWNLKLFAKRPNFGAAYEFIKDGYPKNVQEYWEALDKSRDGPTVADVMS